MAMFVDVKKKDGYGRFYTHSIMFHIGFNNIKEQLSNINEDLDHSSFVDIMNERVKTVQADGDELARCCAILGRQLPTSRVYTFVGDNAKEIVINW